VSGGRLSIRGWAGALAVLFASAACDRGATPAPEPAADSLDAAGADTQFVRDSLGNELMIVSKRTAHLLPREVHPRAGAGDISAPDGWRVVDPRTAHSLMQAARPPWYVLDVRTSREYASGGHIAGAALVPLDQLTRNVEDLHVRTDQIVLVYADDELRAVDAARTLAGYGFPHLRVLGGGLSAWKEAGLPVEER
jgi:rhodanese-related sulfurtransferase